MNMSTFLLWYFICGVAYFVVEVNAGVWNRTRTLRLFTSESQFQHRFRYIFLSQVLFSCLTSIIWPYGAAKVFVAGCKRAMK